MTKINPPQYSEDNIEKLNPVDHVRRRPTMYFETVHDLILNPVSDVMNDVFHGRCDKISVTLYDDGRISVQDNGRGIFVQPFREQKIAFLERHFTEIGQVISVRYEPEDEKSYQVTGSLCMSGFMDMTAVCALSESLVVKTKRDGFEWEQNFKQGYTTSELRQLRPLSPNEHTGTVVTFKPELELMQGVIDHDVICHRLQQFAFLHHGLHITFTDLRTDADQPAKHFLYENGMIDYVAELNLADKPLHTVIHNKQIITLGNKYTFDIEAEFALQYVADGQGLIRTFANYQETPYGGTHLEGTLHALKDVLNTYIEDTFVLDDIKAELTLVISIWHPAIQFESYIVRKLLNPDVFDVMYNLVSSTLKQFANTHPDDMRRIVERCIANKNQREQRYYGE